MGNTLAYCGGVLYSSKIYHTCDIRFTTSIYFHNLMSWFLLSADMKSWVKIVSKQVDTTATYPTTLGTSQTSDEGIAIGSLRAVLALLVSSRRG